MTQLMNGLPPLVMEEVNDPAELAKARAQNEQFQRNFAWFEAHAAELFANYRGHCICIAGAELFAADTPEEALALSVAAHPEDAGRFLHYIRGSHGFERRHLVGTAPRGDSSAGATQRLRRREPFNSD